MSYEGCKFLSLHVGGRYQTGDNFPTRLNPTTLGTVI